MNRGSNKLTMKQRKFIEKYIATGNAFLAAKKSYKVNSDATARAMGSENLTKPNIQKAIQDALEANGLTNEHLARKVAELVNAQKKVFIFQKGKTTVVREELDTQAIKAGLEFAFKLKEKNLGHDNTDGNLTDKDRKKIDTIIQGGITIFSNQNS